MPNVHKLYVNTAQLMLLRDILHNVDTHGMVWGVQLGITRNREAFVALCNKVDAEVSYAELYAPGKQV